MSIMSIEGLGLGRRALEQHFMLLAQLMQALLIEQQMGRYQRPHTLLMLTQTQD